MYGADKNQRVLFSCNYTAKAASPVLDFEGEILKLLNTAGYATRRNNGSNTGDTIFGPSAEYPTGPGPWINILNTSPLPPEETHNNDKYENLSCQVIVCAASYVIANTRALNIWRALDGVRNVTVVA